MIIQLYCIGAKGDGKDYPAAWMVEIFFPQSLAEKLYTVATTFPDSMKLVVFIQDELLKKHVYGGEDR
ncbi:hypothetical protein T08_11306 [Trichinella sp. T8]|nr:hypothetical protein T08_11306 [Trichinella sp. T8]